MSLYKFAQERGISLNEAAAMLSSNKKPQQEPKAPPGKDQGSSKQPTTGKKKSNPISLRNYVDREKLEGLLSGIDSQKGTSLLEDFPYWSPFSGITEFLKNDHLQDSLREQFGEEYSLESVLSEEGLNIYPRLGPKGGRIGDNIWFLEGANEYNTASREQKDQITEIRSSLLDKTDFLDFGVKLESALGSAATLIPASLYILSVDHGRDVKKYTLETARNTSRAFDMYAILSQEVKDKVKEVGREHRSDYFNLTHEIYKEGLFDKILEETKGKGKDRSAIASVIALVLGEENILLRNSKSANGIDWAYSNIRSVDKYKEKFPEEFDIIVDMAKQEFDDAREEETIEAIIRNNIKPGASYHQFNSDLAPREIRYTTFMNYMRTAFQIRAVDQPEFEPYAKAMSKFTEGRIAQNVDRLRGRIGATKLVDLCKEKRSHGEMHRALKSDWREYRQLLLEEGCWDQKARRSCFSKKEVELIYSIYHAMPELFVKTD